MEGDINRRATQRSILRNNVATQVKSKMAIKYRLPSSLCETCVTAVGGTVYFAGAEGYDEVTGESTGVKFPVGSGVVIRN